MRFNNGPVHTGMTKKKLIEELTSRGWKKSSGVSWVRKVGRSIRRLDLFVSNVGLGRNNKRRIDSLPTDGAGLDKLFGEYVHEDPKPKVKRKPNAAFMAPMQPDEVLAAVVGNKAIPRTEITKKLWYYIKKNGLQDATNKRQINADDKLKAVFGKSKVSMFEMTELLKAHITRA